MRTAPQYIAAFILFAGCTASIRSATLPSTQCKTSAQSDEIKLVWRGDVKERVRLQQAPHGASRKSAQQLQVHWARGLKTFTDKDYEAGSIGGLHWEYCGYSSVLKLHLICKNDEDLFTGVLLDDQTGDLLPGGNTVLFSPNRQFYLASEQMNGKAVADITLHKRNGEVIWTGVDGFVMPDGVIEFDDVHWNCNNQLQGTAQRDDGHKMTVTLTQDRDGKREWLPKLPK